MKSITKILLIAICMCISKGISAEPTPQTSHRFTSESLNYEIVYHWGLIWKHAASATLSTTPSADAYNTSLTARTVSWADKVYRVRDTLTCKIKKEGLRPVKYVKSSHEGKYYAKDILTYSYPNDSSAVNCTAIRKSGTDHLSLQSPGQAYDMLSVFYYLRAINYENFKTQGKLKTIIFSGRQKENLTVKYVGKESVKLRDKSTHDSYHITFNFTEDGQKKSSSDIHCWISTDEKHIPLMLKGSVRIGEVRVYYKAN